MKPINQMTLDELAEYAPMLDRWEWMDGVKVAQPNNRGVARIGPTFGSHMTISSDRPDLTDPATLGCVLAMVRANGPSTWTVYTSRGWQVMTYERVESIESYIAIIQTVRGDEDTITLDEMDDDEIVIDPGTGEPLGRFADIAIKMQSPDARINCVVSASEEMPSEIHALIAALEKEVQS